MTTRYLGHADIARWFGVSSATVVKWRTRYEDFPEPDVFIPDERGGTVGWSKDRELQIREWEKGRPGRGARSDLKP